MSAPYPYELVATETLGRAVSVCVTGPAQYRATIRARVTGEPTCSPTLDSLASVDAWLLIERVTRTSEWARVQDPDTAARQIADARRRMADAMRRRGQSCTAASAPTSSPPPSLAL